MPSPEELLLEIKRKNAVRQARYRSKDVNKVKINERARKRTRNNNEARQELFQLKRDLNINNEIPPPPPVQCDQCENEHNEENHPPDNNEPIIEYPGNKKVVIHKNNKKWHTMEQVMTEMDKLEYPSDVTKEKRKSNVRTVFKITGCKHFEPCVKQFKSMEKSLTTTIQNNGNPYSNNAVRDYVIGLNTVIKGVKVIRDQISDEVVAFYDQFIKDCKGTSTVNTMKNQNKETWQLIEFEWVLNKTFAEDSKERLIAELFLFCGCRENISKLNIIPSITMADKDKTINYVVVPKTKGNVTIIIQDHKTQKHFPRLEKTLPLKLSKMIRDWISANNLENGRYLCYNSNMSNFISEKILAPMGISGLGSVNFFRHMRVSNQDLDNATPQEIQLWADEMAHSVDQHYKYKRKLKPIDPLILAEMNKGKRNKRK